MYLNKIMVLGNLTKDPELKSLNTGTKVCTFSLATNRTWKDKNGQVQKDAEFHNVVAWGKTAELVAQYMRKGSQMLVEGRLTTRSWESQSGEKKYRTEIVLEQMQFGNKPQGQSAPRPEYPDDPSGQSPVEDTGEVNPKDIPF